jgi:ABC-type multidrug transport system fused ATPase/permease subunit
VTNDISTLEMVISQGVVEIATNLLLVTLILVVLFVLDWRLALVMSVLLPILVVSVWKLASAQRMGFREQRAWLSRINAYLAENITGMNVIQLFNRQEENLRRFDERNAGLLRANMRVVALYAIFEPVVVIFNAVTVAVILWYGGGQAVRDAISLGTLVAFLQYMQRFYLLLADPRAGRPLQHTATGDGVVGTGLRRARRTSRNYRCRRAAPPRPRAGQDRIPQCLVRVRRRQLGPARRIVRRRARREGRDRGGDGRRQVHHHEPALPLL